jgi:hypothetical protein
MKTVKFLLVIAMLFCGADTFAQRTVGRGTSRGMSLHHISRGDVHYRRPVSRITVSRTLPGKTVVLKHHESIIHFNAGRFFHYDDGRYLWIAPPFGIHLNVLPVGYIQFFIGQDPYYYNQGVYYVEDNEGYEVVEPPLNAIVTTLPEESEKVEIDGQTYYECYGTIYQIVRTPDGKAFQVVGRIDDEE